MPFLFPHCDPRLAGDGPGPLPIVRLHNLRAAILGVALGGSGAAAAADNLAEYLDLARAGAPGLAVELMERARPEPALDLIGWMQWEQELVRVLAAWEEWPAVIERLQALPEEVPPDFRDWSAVQRAKAHIALGQGHAARLLLLGLIWVADETPDTDELALLRRLIVESYLADQAHADAREALLRYQQDYGATEDTRSLRAQILLQAERFDEAAAVLADATGGEDLAMRLHAELRSGRISPEQAWDRAAQALEQTEMAPELQGHFYLVSGEAAELAGWPVRRILAFEQGLARAPLEGMAQSPMGLDPDRLWRAYLVLGEDRGNQAQLLLGNDEAWLDMAGELEQEDAAVSRALYAVLLLRSRSPAAREQAAISLMDSLPAQGEGSERVIQHLFLDSERFARLDTVPLSVRYRLVDKALVRGDIDLATRLMRGLERAPADSDPIAWGLRRARVLILGGHYEEGSDSVARLIAAIEAGDRELIDRILQVVFDLQTVEQHEAAIAHLQALLTRATDPQQRREILFWMADSHEALGDHRRAAFLYLRSATLYETQAMDPWGQTARYNAAEALASAGLLEDSRRLYRQLLAVTREPARRAVLRQNIQQLWLKD